MMKSLSYLLIVAFFASSTIAQPLPDNAVAVGVYTSGADLDGDTEMLEQLMPVVLSPCGRIIDWHLVFAGRTNMTKDDHFTCVGGPANCEYLETVNCLKKVIRGSKDDDIETYSTTSLLGRGGPSFVIEQLNGDWQDRLNECVASGMGKRYLHQAIQITENDVKWEKETDAIAVTINDVQQPNVFANPGGLWNPLCKATKDKRCCPLMDPPKNFRGASLVEAEMQEVESEEEKKKKHKIGVYTSGKDIFSSFLLVDKIAPMVYSTCAQHFDFDFVFAGQSKELGPNSFECKTGQENCEWLEAMNCLQEALDDGSAPRLRITRDMLKYSLLGRSDVKGLTEAVMGPVRDTMKKCIDKGRGKVLFSDAIAKTKGFNWDENHELFAAMMIDGEHTVVNLWAVDPWFTMCALTQRRECCLTQQEQQVQRDAFYNSGDAVFKAQQQKRSIIEETQQQQQDVAVQQ